MDDPVDDTICAIATPVGEGGIGIIRVSGPDAVSVAGRMVCLRNGASLREVESHRLYVSDVVSPGGPLVSGGPPPPSVMPEPVGSQEGAGGQSGPGPPLRPLVRARGMHSGPPLRHACERRNPREVLDEALVVVMRAPRSYTGEDVVEIQTHGGGLIVQAVCAGLVAHGARLAQPGEFTRRAFLHGRVDLAQAEAVLDTIQATTARGLQAAQALLRGGLSRELDALRDRLLGVLAHLEAGMDFAEDEVADLDLQAAQQVVAETRRSVERLIASSDEGRVVREGLTVAIVGRPNVGKSSLLNALLQVERAIVSDQPGTTRDVIDASMQVGGIALRLLDTAGLRPTRDQLEAEGMRRTEDAIADADVLVLVIDGAVGVTEADRALLDTCAGPWRAERPGVPRRALPPLRPRDGGEAPGDGRPPPLRHSCPPLRHSCERRNPALLLVVNKMDLPEARACLSAHAGMPAPPPSPGQSQGPAFLSPPPSFLRTQESSPLPVVPVSARTGEGLDSLKAAIRDVGITPAREAAPSVLVTRLRHRSNLERARGCLDEALHALHRQDAGECVALDLRAALDALGEITGAVSTEDLLDRIFQEFCIGK